MRYFPLMVDTQDKKMLVVGGGKAAAIKIQGLVDSSFLFYCLAPAFCDDLIALADAYPERIFLKEKKVDGDFRFFAYDYFIVATDDEALNAALLRRAKAASVPVLSTSDPETSDFHMASVLRRGPLAVSISADNPTVSKYVKVDMEEFLSNYDEEKLFEMNRIRRLLVERKSAHISEIMEELWNDEIISKNYGESLDET
ncbi:precorrin-2 dehydrogenase/sirohydrochlorin ferrochelatase family protein [Aedoeadaptatus acetigenes]|uniref:precorrin-2 dehydrogenase/sirohydrochlorin ferrochelatase family protein n=1 Tax=Aedoeadaptatus acetigenes TaxID=2981723 RepID=UPI002265A975|nr:NAD(P)-dependent oxidoreductase [Aedoeadaptatus acetigenes]MCU6786320.1 hypothetical protein [Aedoeadaptatus acetigenes]